MAYEMVHEAADMALNVWDERDRLHVALYFRDRDDQGDLCVEWWDGEARQAFEDGFLSRGRPGRSGQGDAALLESALAYARDHKLASLSDHAARVVAAVSRLAESLPEAYAALDAADEAGEEDDLDDRRQRLVENAVEAAIEGDALVGGLGESRRGDIAGFLEEDLSARLESAAAPRP